MATKHAATRLAWIGGTVLAAVLAFAITWSVTSPAPTDGVAQETEQAASVDTVEVVFAPPVLTGPPRPPGVWDWVELRGGECLQATPPDGSVEVVVVDCAMPHGARYLSPTLASSVPSDPFPGADHLTTLATAQCQSVSARDLGIAVEVDDLISVGLFSPDEVAWRAGSRVIGCLVSRVGGENLPAVVAEGE
jgi:hypothetical protein